MNNPLWSNFFKPSREELEMISLLEELPVFEGMSRSELRQFESRLHSRHYYSGEIVFGENMPGAGMYIVKEGEVVIRKNIKGEKDIDLAYIGERSFFGEIALLDEVPRSASAFASRESVLLAFGKPDLENLNERNPRLALKILSNISRLVCRRLVKANEKLEEMESKLSEMAPGSSQGEEE